MDARARCQHGSLLPRRRCKRARLASAGPGRERAPHQRALPADARGRPAPAQVQRQQALRPGQLAVAGAALPGRPRQRRRQRDAALSGPEACAQRQAAIVLSTKPLSSYPQSTGCMSTHSCHLLLVQAPTDLPSQASACTHITGVVPACTSATVFFRHSGHLYRTDFRYVCSRRGARRRARRAGREDAVAQAQVEALHAADRRAGAVQLGQAHRHAYEPRCAHTGRLFARRHAAGLAGSLCPPSRTDGHAGGDPHTLSPHPSHARPGARAGRLPVWE